MNAPPVVHKHVERAQDQDEESGRPLRLEPYRDHTARSQPHDRHQHSCDTPLSLNDESQKEEDEQDAAGEKEAAKTNPVRIDSPLMLRPRSLFLSVVFADGWKSGERSPSGNHRVAEYHE